MEWIAAEKRVTRDRFPAFNAFEQECVVLAVFEFEESLDGRQQIRDHGSVHRDHISLGP
jgi:hypothetical protein